MDQIKKYHPFGVENECSNKFYNLVTPSGFAQKNDKK